VTFQEILWLEANDLCTGAARMNFEQSGNEHEVPSHHTTHNPRVGAVKNDKKDSVMLCDTHIAMGRLKHTNYTSTAPVAMTIKESPSVTISRLKARQDLYLPPFKSLLVAAPPPNLLLTPPDDTEPCFWKPRTPFSTFQPSKRFHHTHSVSMSSQESKSSNMPLAENPVSESGADTPTPQHSQSQSPPGLINSQADDTTPSASNAQELGRYGESAWLDEALEVVGELGTGEFDEWQLI
jgi:hypothetical protein